MNKKHIKIMVFLLIISFCVTEIALLYTSFIALRRIPLVTYDSPQECIMNHLKNLNERDKSKYIESEITIFEYECEDKYVRLFGTNNKDVWYCELDKSLVDGKTKYTFCAMQNTGIVDMWHGVQDRFCYKLIKNKDEKESYNGIEPIMKKVTFMQGSKKVSGYLLFVDSYRFDSEEEST